jgi:hypothetical protein
MKPIVLGEDVKRYKYLERTNHFLIYPYILEEGKQRILEETELQKMYPLTYGYLSQFKTYLIEIKKRFKTNPKYWYALHRPRQKE